MALVNQILNTIKPTIPTRSIPVLNIDPANASQNDSDPLAGTIASTKGAIIPVIRFVDAYTVPIDQIIEMEVAQTGFLPTCRVTIWDKNHLFGHLYYPVFDPVMSVYVKPENPNLKPLRCDFLITHIGSTPMEDGTKMYHVEGELYIPRLYDNVSKSYSQVKSTDCLKAVCTDLGLGYSSNEENTDDLMTWVNPNLSYYSFIRDEVVKRAYKDDRSFFTCFIDRYYCLNFVNVEKQMAQDGDFDQSFIVDHFVKSQGVLSTGDKLIDGLSVQADVVLSNHPVAQGSVNAIKEHRVVSNNGDVLRREAFRKQMYWYDSTQQKSLNFFIEPLSSTQTLTGSEHQTPILPDLSALQVKKWTGFEFGNAHKHNKYAQALNFHNMAEMEKSQLLVELNALNPVVTRGSRVPVSIYNETYFDAMKKGAMGRLDLISDATNYRYYIDTMLSDVYYVKDIVYRYQVMRKPMPFSTEMVLAKRNWVKQPFNQ